MPFEAQRNPLGESVLRLHGSVLATIETFYAAAGGELPWDDAWDKLLSLTGFTGASIFPYDRDALVVASMERQPVSPGIWHRIDPDFGRRYTEEGYYNFDPQRRFLLENIDRVRIRYDALHSTEQEMERDPYYAELERHTGNRYYLGAVTDPKQSIGATICLQRPRAAGHATAREIEIFRILLPHFERAFLLWRRLGIAPGSPTAALLDLNPLGIVVITATGRLVFANRAAETMARASDAFSLTAEGIQALRRSDDVLLQKLIAAAASPQRGGGLLALARRSGARDYVVRVMPLPSGTDLVAGGGPAACILISDPAMPPPCLDELLSSLFRLTEMESRVAECLAAGDSIQQAAERLGIAPATVRTHLAAIFNKTGTRRQPDLVRLLLTLPSAPD